MALSKRENMELSKQSAEAAPGNLRMSSSKLIKSYSIDSDLAQRLENYRTKTGSRSTSSIVNEAIKEFLENRS